MEDEFEQYKALVQGDIEQRQKAQAQVEKRLNEAQDISKKIVAFNERQTIALEKIAKALEKRK
jgi:hypothetical protein